MGTAGADSVGMRWMRVEHIIGIGGSATWHDNGAGMVRWGRAYGMRRAMILRKAAWAGNTRQH